MTSSKNWVSSLDLATGVSVVSQELESVCGDVPLKRTWCDMNGVNQRTTLSNELIPEYRGRPKNYHTRSSDRKKSASGNRDEEHGLSSQTCDKTVTRWMTIFLSPIRDGTSTARKQRDTQKAKL